MRFATVALALLTACDPGAAQPVLSDVADDERELAFAANHHIAPPWSRPFGQSYREWAADWWRWALAIPAGSNPILDTTGADCARGQRGAVWFLAGTFAGVAERECTIPRGRALFFPLASVLWVQTLQDPALSIPELRGIVRAQLEGTELFASIDGRPVLAPQRYDEDSPVIVARLPDDNVLAIDDGSCPRDAGGTLTCAPFLDAGYYLFVWPLRRGTHHIELSSFVPFFGQSIDVRYTLHVR